MSAAIFVVVLLSVAFSAHAQLTADIKWSGERIVGGQIALPGRFPYQVALTSSTNPPHGSIARVFCGGTIIHQLWILTSAHCVIDRTAEEVQVLVGSSNLVLEGESYAVERIISHPDFNRVNDLENNIALVQLAEPLRLSKTVNLIALKPRVVGNFTSGLVSGFGSTESGRPATKLRYLNVYTLSNENCREQLGQSSRFVHNSVVCAALRQGAGLCRLDSGSPLVANHRLIGVASWHVFPCGSGKPDGYTRISSFVEWISENTGIEVQ